MAALVAAARGGERRAVARLVSLVEDDSPALAGVMAALGPPGRTASVVGITGSPGVGKSTSTSALVSVLRARGSRVAVLAVDPSSPFTGGALLGDRVRMTEHAGDPGVFIRSLASRGHLGGLSAATPRAARVLDAVGFDVIIIETVGVGQAEVDIAALADTTVVVLAPGLGDGIQAAKAGILEIADVFVVNKADRPGARETASELRRMLGMAAQAAAGGDGGWRPPVLMTVSSRSEGLAELADAVAEHRAWLEAAGELTRRRRRRAAEEIIRVALDTLRARMTAARPGVGLDALAERVGAGELDPYAAAATVLDRLGVGSGAGAEAGSDRAR